MKRKSEKAHKNQAETRYRHRFQSRHSILPCPWCGEKPEFVSGMYSWNNGRRKFSIECEGAACPVQPATVEYVGGPAAIRAWNRRRA